MPQASMACHIGGCCFGYVCTSVQQGFNCCMTGGCDDHCYMATCAACFAERRPSAFRRWQQWSIRHGAPIPQPPPASVARLDTQHSGINPDPDVTMHLPQLPPQIRRSPTRPPRSVAPGSTAGTRSQAYSRSQHDPTGQNWRWNLAGAAGGPTPASTFARHDPTGQNWRWNLDPSSARGSPSNAASNAVADGGAGAARSGERMTPRRARESSGDGLGVPRPWRRRRLQADSPAVPADESHSAMPAQDSGELLCHSDG